MQPTAQAVGKVVREQAPTGRKRSYDTDCAAHARARCPRDSRRDAGATISRYAETSVAAPVRTKIRSAEDDSRELPAARLAPLCPRLRYCRSGRRHGSAPLELGGETDDPLPDVLAGHHPRGARPPAC